MAVIYKDLTANSERNQQVVTDVATAISKGRNCLVLTNWTGHLETITSALRALGTTRSSSRAAWAPKTVLPRSPGSSLSRAGRRCSP
jgi:hypothetical protein